MGTHSQLLRAEGHYYRIYTGQWEEKRQDEFFRQLTNTSYSVDGVAGLKVDDTVMHYISDILEPRERCIKEIIIHGALIKILFWDMGWFCSCNIDEVQTKLIKVKDEKKV